ncbi:MULTISPECIES: LGFP repeat-containing protein [Mycolicibacterium]|uniref:LGFP repeat-containing protein n=1 Tax=Mycolicibacterium TaxID=1866885 RepID=UPI001E35DE35|nr:hypothetical protein [Mycolicibacterium mageritense]GJJ19156.1 hypothetical protein MTY414_28290 [Mycolicibacterium mageritense]
MQATGSAVTLVSVLAVTVSGVTGCARPANPGQSVDAPVVADAGVTVPNLDDAVSMHSTTIPTPGGPFVVQGEILQKYLAFGGVSSALGLPTSDELSARGGSGRYSTFTGGAIYWTHRTGAHVVWGRIREGWERSGGPDGPLGYPTTDERSIPDGWESTFQHGIIAHTRGQTRIETR